MSYIHIYSKTLPTTVLITGKWRQVTYKESMFTYVNARKKTPRDIHFMYLGKKEI